MRSLLHLAGIAALAMISLASCGRATPADPPHSSRGEPDAVYTVRGRVEQVPAPEKPLAEFFVKHEPIDDFKNPDGTLGMDTMSMPFPLAKGVTLTGIAPGDLVEIDMAVWTKPGSRGFEARRVTRLPPDTQLRFVRARKPAGHE